jgi:outer membrane protein
MNHFRKIVFVVAVLSVALTLGSVAQAQQSPFAIDNVPNIVGVAVGVAPDYWGSDDSQGVGAPFFRWTFEGQERYLQLLATELSLNVLDNANYYFGPVLNYRPGRDDDVDDDVVKKMTEIDGTVELGVMGAYIWRNQANPRHRFIASAQVLGDVGGEYEGWMAMAGVRYWYPINKPLDVLIGLGTTYGNSDFMNTYFGVSSADVAKSGLSRFDAGSGFRDINIPVALVFHYSMNWHVAAGFKYFKLLDDASDSPITDLRGSDNQLIAGLGVAYSW